MEDGLATLSLSTDTRQAEIIEQLQDLSLQNKDPDTAFLLEFLGGILGFLGIGYMYSGLTNAGVLRLIVLWLSIAITWSIAWTFSVFLIGFCMMPFLFIAQVGAAYISANELKQGILFAQSAQGEFGRSKFIGYLDGDTQESPLPPSQHE